MKWQQLLQDSHDKKVLLKKVKGQLNPWGKPIDCHCPPKKQVFSKTVWGLFGHCVKLRVRAAGCW